MKLSVAEKLGLVINTQKVMSLQGLGRIEYCSLGLVDVDVCLYNMKLKSTRFQIIQNICIGHDIILGVDFFMRNDLIINLAARKISKVFCDGSRIDLYIGMEDELLIVIHENVPV